MKAIHIVITSALLTAAAIKAAPALAQPASNGEVAVSFVRTADLDLSTTKGQRALDQRLSAAAREVCGSASDADLEGKNAVRECRDSVLATARAERDALVAANQRGAMIAVTAAR